MELPKLVIVEERAVFRHKYRSRFTCTSCNRLQGCNKSRNYVCSDFDLCSEPGERPKKSRDLCSGCHNNFYNYGRGAKMAIGGSCMSYGSSSVELKPTPYHINHVPPWPPRWNLSCFRRKY